MFPQIFGKYMLEREIAAGGMARVYLATLRGAGGFEKRLVVKQIRPELASDQGFVERFVKEAKTAVELSHPNIVPVYELGVEQGVYYIAMEHCDGATLAELLSEGGPLGAEEGAYLGVEVCRALDYAHRRAQVIHRDVTPRNVLIDDEGAVRLIDFGIAAPVAESDAQERSEVFGSPGHMPPEQLVGQALGPPTDVFAVGVLLYEALTGRPAFRRGSAKESRDALKEEQPALDVNDASLARLAPVVAAAMRLSTEERTENAEALARPLREFLRTADAGDVARRLGKRAQRARARQHATSPWQLGEGMTGLGSGTGVPKGDGATPASGTQTFATNRSFTELTRRIDSEPPAPGVVDGPNTRRIPGTSLGGSDAARSDAGAAGRAESATGRQRRRIGLGSVSLGIALGLPAALAIFTLFNGQERPEVVASRGAAPASASAETKHVPSRVPHLQSDPPAQASESARTRTQAVPAGAVSQAVARAFVPTARTTRVAQTASAAASTGEAMAARLSLTALPGTRVTVAGKEYATPVESLSLAPGAYRVTFRSATWDAPVSTQVVLLPGKQSRVHADFTNEPPQLVIR